MKRDGYIFVVNGPSYFAPFAHLGFQMVTDAYTLRSRPHKVALVVFTGGEDVGPQLYGHKNVRSRVNDKRDRYEVSIFNLARHRKVPVAGICRGAQFLCAMAGGTLIQDVTGHTGPRHRVRYMDDKGVSCISPEGITSTHHQMQYPWDMPKEDYEVLAWSPKPLSDFYVHNGTHIPAGFANEDFEREPDCVWYPKIQGLAMQYHPEYMAKDSWGFKYAQRLVNEKLKPIIDERMSDGIVAAAKALPKVWK